MEGSKLLNLIKVLLCFICGYTFIHHLNNEIWNDEYYTLNHFVFVPLKTTLLDYHVPNNHILFSLFIKGYLTLIGYADLKTVLMHPFIARLPLIFIALISLIYFWKISRYFFIDIRWRYISLLLLCSNVVFGNFMFQYRGYGIATMFLSIIFYYLLKIIVENRGSLSAFFILVIAAFFAFYTSPSNLYFIILLGIYPSIKYFVNKNNFSLYLKSLEFKMGIFLFLGLLLGFFAYLPIFNQVFNNEYVTNSSPFAFTNFERLFKALLELSSFHFVLFVFGIYYLGFNLFKKNLNPNSVFWFPLMLCVLPSLFSFLHGDVPPDRVYSVLLPFFTLLIAKSLFELIHKFNFNSYSKVYLIIPLYISAHFFLSELYLYNRLGYDNSTNNRDQNLTLQYHNYHFNSSEMIKLLQNENGLPVYFEENFDNSNELTNTYGIKANVLSLDSIKDQKFQLISNKTFINSTGINLHFYLENSDKNYFKIYIVEKGKGIGG